MTEPARHEDLLSQPPAAPAVASTPAPTGPASDVPATSPCEPGQRTIDTNVTECRLGLPPQTGSGPAFGGHTHAREGGGPALPPGRGSAILAPDSTFPGLRHNEDTCPVRLPRAVRCELPGSPTHLPYRGTQCTSRVLIMAIWTPLSVRAPKSLHTIPGWTEGKLGPAWRGSAGVDKHGPEWRPRLASLLWPALLNDL